MQARANNLLVIGTGSIAAVKLPDLLARLGEFGITADLWLTKAGRTWTDIPSRTLAPETEDQLIEALGRADAVLIAPASASAIARLVHAQGKAAGAVAACGKPVMLVPAMNIRMWQHPATQRNVRALLAQAVHSLGPVAGDLACGDFGHGRMMEPHDIVQAVVAVMQQEILLPVFSLVQDALRTDIVLAGNRLPHRILLMPTGTEREKIPALISGLVSSGANITLVVAAAQWQPAETERLGGLTGNPVYSAHRQHDPEGFEHIRLGESVDAVFIAPLDAVTACRMRMGLADDFFMATYLASKAPVMAVAALGAGAPAPGDLDILRSDGVVILERGDAGLLPRSWSEPR